MTGLMLLLVGCGGTEYNLFSESQLAAEAVEITKMGPPTPEVQRVEPEPVWHRVEVPKRGGGTAYEAFITSDGHRRDVFEVGTQTPYAMVDFLFVVDNSKSMDAVVEGVQAGFAALAGSDAFPRDARIAVTNTLPSAALAPSELHEAVRSYRGITAEPGFQRLVDAAGIERYNKRMGEAGFSEPGCSAWFAPEDRNSNGVPCLVAHTQISKRLVAVEAGLVSVGQMLDRGSVSFRPGAVANIVFVSDTHGPGIKPEHVAYDELVALQPSAEALASAAEMNHPLAGFRVHSIAPNTGCVNEPWEEPVYHQRADETKGKKLDVCSAGSAQYVSFIRDIVESGKVASEPVVVLREAPGEIDAVSVDGRNVGFVSVNQTVVLDGDMPTKKSRVEVRYREVGTTAAEARAILESRR